MSEVIPTKTIDIEKTFNIETKMNVKGFVNSTDRVPEIDSSYRFSRETTLAEQIRKIMFLGTDSWIIFGYFFDFFHVFGASIFASIFGRIFDQKKGFR